MTDSASAAGDPAAGEVRAALLAWYARHRRALPWRAAGPAPADPYRVWLSEIMLQQTTVAAVVPYFQDFVTRWPDVAALAAAPVDDVLAAWAGLGYYARARNMHACARAVAGEFAGRFPRDEAALRRLPGIGPYTAAAIAAIAFGARACPVDGNVERVVARLFAVETPLPAAKPALRARAQALLPAPPAGEFRYGDFAQATMDLGATVCLPRRPRCASCPLRNLCLARAAGRAEDLPRQAPKAQRPTRRGVAFWLAAPDGAVLLRRRPPRGLLGGMMEVPSTEWRVAEWGAAGLSDARVRADAPAPAEWSALPGVVRHTFTHFHLELTVWAARAEAGADIASGTWVRPDDLGGIGLPTVMRKVARHALGHAGAASPS